MASFELEVCQSGEGWGPSNELFEEAGSLPFDFFKKGSRLANAADWERKQHRDRGDEETIAAPEEESTFTLVDTSTVQTNKPTFRRRQYHRYASRRKDDREKRPASARGQKAARSKRERNRQLWWSSRPRTRRWNEPEQKRDPSVHVEEHWNEIKDFEFTDLSKLSMSLKEVPKGETLLDCGGLAHYLKTVDGSSCRSPQPLIQLDSVNKVTSTTSEDPLMQQFVEKDDGDVFITDTILALLMTCPRAVYGWDVVVRKENGKIFFDQRPDSTIDFLTVHETTMDPPASDKDTINHPHRLSNEATFVHHAFAQHVLSRKQPVQKYNEPNPFLEGLSAKEKQDNVPIAYRYRRFNFGEGTRVVCRTEMHGYTTRGNNKLSVMIMTLNQWDSTVAKSYNWGKMLDKQKGTVLVTEMRNNSYKMARWAAQALLSNVEELKLGYVSRVNVKDNRKHQIVGTQRFVPGLFAKQLSVSWSTCWAIFRHLLDTIRAQPDGTYLIMKDANKPMVRVFSIPTGTFEDEEGIDAVPVVVDEPFAMPH